MRTPRVILRAVLIVGVALLAGGQLARLVLIAQSSPTGTLVDIGGRRLNVVCQGDGRSTVWLEAGLNDFSVQWDAVQRGLAATTRVCAYDRAGLGWSDPPDGVPDLEAAASDLARLVRDHRPGRPVVLVGHSYGALIVRVAAERLGSLVSGVVLVDPAHEDQLDELPALRGALGSAASVFRALDLASRAGALAALQPWIPARGLTGRAKEAYASALATRPYFRWAAAETEALAESAELLQRRRVPFGSVPLVVISRGRAEPLPGADPHRVADDEARWQRLQRRTVALSLQGSQRIAGGSGHAVPQERPDIVIEAVREMVVRSR